MVAPQEDPRRAEPAINQRIHHLSALRPAVDVVPEEHQRAVRDRVGGEIVLDTLENPLEQIEATMDIADRIDTRTGGHGGPLVLPTSAATAPEKLQHPAAPRLTARVAEVHDFRPPRHLLSLK